MKIEDSEKLSIIFNQLAEFLNEQLQTGEHFYLELDGESSHFTRFNRAKVRQAATVNDGTIKLTLIAKQRTAFAAFPFTGEIAIDQQTALENLHYLRQEIPQLPEDPYLVLPRNWGNSHEIQAGNLLSPETAITAILSAVENLDMAGLYTAGTVIRGYANSAGQQHWFAGDSFVLDYSLIAPSEKAVKKIWAGKNWEQAAYESQIIAAKNQLLALDSPTQKIQPGRYRTYLAPAATAALVNTLSWGAVSEASLRQGGSALAKLRQKKTLSLQLTLQENFRNGTAPRFNELGEVAPEILPLIVGGELVNTLINSRTAKEYNLTANGANRSEMLRSPELAIGTLKEEDILSSLGTGLYLSNLHYLNWSDRVGGRITGMTRYACFWVENGELVAPIEDLRFDESLYNFWGDNLENLTDFQEFIPDTGTYNKRQLGGCLSPGILVRDFSFTL